MMRDEYRIKRVTEVRAATLKELCNKLEDVNSAKAFDANKAVMTDVKFDPNIKDGRSTRGLGIPKSNWAITIDGTPFEAYAATCCLSFTFGGLKIDSGAYVMDTDGAPIRGLFAAGELVGGLFYFNHPGATGLINGSCSVHRRTMCSAVAMTSETATDRSMRALPAARKPRCIRYGE